jgi:hypothetical protein
MKKLLSASLLAATLFLSSFMKHNTEVKDYLNIPGPLSFNGTNYNISWSAHPTAAYYKQEYLEKGEDANRFNKMVMMEAVLSSTLQPKDAVAAKMAELDQRKKTDALVNYQTITNAAKTEYIFDFLLSDGPASAPNIVEWNAYRYKIFTDKSGHKGIMLFAISMRAYGDKVKPFLNSLKEVRPKVITSLTNYNLPQISLK